MARRYMMLWCHGNHGPCLLPSWLHTVEAPPCSLKTQALLPLLPHHVNIYILSSRCESPEPSEVVTVINRGGFGWAECFMLCSGVLLPSYERCAESQRDENAGQIKVNCILLLNHCLEFSVFQYFRTRLFHISNMYSTFQITVREGDICGCLHINK